MNKTLLTTFFSFMLLCAFHSANALNFLDLPYYEELSVFDNKTTLTESDFLIYEKVPEAYNIIVKMNKKDSEEYISKKLKCSLNRLVYISIKITTIYTVVYENNISDPSAQKIFFDIIDPSINPSSDEITLMDKYKTIIKNTRTKLQYNMER